MTRSIIPKQILNDEMNMFCHNLQNCCKTFFWNREEKQIQKVYWDEASMEIVFVTDDISYRFPIGKEISYTVKQKHDEFYFDR